MVVSIIIAIIIIAIIIFTIIKTVKNIIIGVSLITIILLAAYILLGYVPSLKSIPIIGRFIPSVPTISDMITWIKKYFRNIEINEISRDSENNLLITITNTGRLQASNISVYVDNKSVDIINKPKDPLKFGETTSIQTNWDEDFSGILIQTSKLNVSYSK